MTKLRQGRRVSRHLYEQQGPEPADTDPPIGMVDTPELAAKIVKAVNEADQLAMDLQHAERENRRLHEENKRLKGT